MILHNKTYEYSGEFVLTNVQIIKSKNASLCERREAEVSYDTTLLFGGIEGCVIPIYNVHRGEPALIALGYPRGVLE